MRAEIANKAIRGKAETENWDAKLRLRLVELKRSSGCCSQELQTSGSCADIAKQRLRKFAES